MTASRTHNTHDLQLLRNPAIWMCALAAAFTVGTARAATSPDDLQPPANAESMTPKQAYEHDKAFCNSGQSTQPRALCLKEAARAYSEARRGRLDDGVMAQADTSSSNRGSLGLNSSASTSGTGSDMGSHSTSDAGSSGSTGRAARTDRN
jgi:hypothetical protein